MTALTTVPRIRPKQFHFPLAVRWAGGRKVTVDVDWKEPLDIAPPPVFGGVEPAVWSPEDLLVAASAACLAVTFTGLAERAELGYRSLDVVADGVAGTREDGCFGFTRIALELRLAVAAADAERARELAAQAEAQCLVSASLALPVEVTVSLDEL